MGKTLTSLIVITSLLTNSLLSASDDVVEDAFIDESLVKVQPLETSTSREPFSMRWPTNTNTSLKESISINFNTSDKDSPHTNDKFPIYELVHHDIMENVSETLLLPPIPEFNTSSDCSSSLGLLPDWTNCSNYFQLCSITSNITNSTSNFKIKKECPSEKLFDTINLECINAKEAFCGNYSCIHPDDFYEDAKNKAAFIHCFDGKPKRKLCEPKGTTFNRDTKICEWVQEDLTLVLKVFKAFIWFVAATTEKESSTEDRDGVINSAMDYVIVTAVALAIPTLYILSIGILYLQVKRFRSRPVQPLLSDAEEYYRHYTRPSSHPSDGALPFAELSRPRISRTQDSHIATTAF